MILYHPNLQIVFVVNLEIFREASGISLGNELRLALLVVVHSKSLVRILSWIPASTVESLHKRLKE